MRRACYGNRVLTLYRPNALVDARFFHVYQQMIQAEEIVAPGMEMLSGFYLGLQEPSIVLYADAIHKPSDTPWCVFWFVPESRAVACSVWLAPEMRHTKRALVAVLEALGFALATYATVIVTTTNTRLLSNYRRLGFVPMGTMPDLIRAGETAHVWYLTREAYRATEDRFTRLLARERAA